jgi:hypothetical protein
MGKDAKYEEGEFNASVDANAGIGCGCLRIDLWHCRIELDGFGRAEGGYYPYRYPENFR